MKARWKNTIKNVTERKLNETENACGQCGGHFAAVPSLYPAAGLVMQL